MVVCGRELYADFIVHDIPNFDVVLGIDWLGDFFAHIDCHQRKVVFRIPDHPTFEFTSGSSCLEPAKFKAKPMPAVVMCMDVEKPPVVRDFEDVFPEDIMGLPPDRALEFSIDLVPGAQPISKAPYRMSRPASQNEESEA